MRCGSASIIGARLGVDPRSVHADVIGEHGTSQVYLWSTASVAGAPVLSAAFREEVEQEVRFANINIIEGTGASQLGIGVVAARIVEIVLNEAPVVLPIGSYREEHGVTLSLPSQIGRHGAVRVLQPPLSAGEVRGLEKSVAALRRARQSIGASG
jgi:L-lactate dehydrogenase